MTARPDTSACRLRAKNAMHVEDAGRVLMVDVPELCDDLDDTRAQLKAALAELARLRNDHPVPPWYRKTTPEGPARA